MKYQDNIKCFHEHYNKYTIDVVEKETQRKIPVR